MASPAGMLQRTTFEISRASEYLSVTELQAQTGQPAAQFAHVVLKELVDNALDAAETAGVAPVVAIRIAYGAGEIGIQVSDNGPGIPPEVVQRILNFDTRTSDKAHYRAPTRGAQGNALKTVLGIATDNGVVIQAEGARHHVRAWVDPAGEVRVVTAVAAVPEAAGTTVKLRVAAAGQQFDPHHWARAFALLNPHAKVKIRVRGRPMNHGESGSVGFRDSYEPVAREGWSKHTPADPTAPSWWDETSLARLVFAHNAQFRAGGRDLPVREFVQQFRGLTGSAKAKAVAGRIGAQRLSDFDADPDRVPDLLSAMQSEARAPKPATLGIIGEDTLLARLDAWHGVKRHWYRRVAEEHNGIPLVFETIVAETEQPGGLYHGLNFSPTFDDPLSGNVLTGREFAAGSTRDFLRMAHADPSNPHARHITAAVHLVSPGLEFLDRGKTRVVLPGWMRRAIGAALDRATVQLYREGERRRRDAARQERQDQERSRQSRADEWTLRDAVFEVLPEAIDHATGGSVYPVGARSLFYAVRARVQEYTDRELPYQYFAQTLLPEHQEIHGPIEALYYDARGVLIEPHTRREVPLGTREVDNYDFPPFLIRNLLYIEKKGLVPPIMAARLAERFDMAVVAGEGYASVAARSLMDAAAAGHGIRVFVLHDADPAGYEIARTLSEATRRMPDHNIEVVDLGLRIEEAVDLGLAHEEFTRKKALPSTLVMNAAEREYFIGRPAGRAAHIARRVELNAFTAPDLIAFIERKLTEAGATKMVPPAEHMENWARETLEYHVRDAVRESVQRQLGIDAITDQVTDTLSRTLMFSDAAAWVQAGHSADQSMAWSDAIVARLQGHVRGSEGLVDGAVRAALLDMARGRP